MPHQESTPSQADRPTTAEFEDELARVAREGARRLLERALEAEIEEHLNRYTELLTQERFKAVVRNGHGPERTILTGVGPVTVRRPRLDERKAVGEDPQYERFSSGVLPRWMRRTPSVEGVIALLYLKGISTNDFESAIKAIYGEQAGSLSASTVSRLKEAWYQEYEQWRRQPLESSQYAYIWADGVYFNARVEGERSCVLVVIGVKFNGEKELLGIADGVRESEASWKELLRLSQNPDLLPSGFRASG